MFLPALLGILFICVVVAVFVKDRFVRIFGSLQIQPGLMGLNTEPLGEAFKQ